MPTWNIPPHLHMKADRILRELLSRPKHGEGLRRGDMQLYRSLCGAAARMAVKPLPNYKQRQAYIRWKRQREREQLLMDYGDPVTLERPDPALPMPGRPYWRVNRGMPFDPSWAKRRTGRPPGSPRR